MPKYNYGTAVDKLIDNYQEMFTLIVQARIAGDRIDEWKRDLDLVLNPEQTKTKCTSLEFSTWICMECDEVRIGDGRVLFGMKCGNCAYG